LNFERFTDRRASLILPERSNPYSHPGKAGGLPILIIAICDRDSLYGVHTALETAKEGGMRPVIGTILTKVISKEKGEIYCFVRNRAGFGRLCEILTIRNRDSKNYDQPALFREQSEGLIPASSSFCLTGGL
jgi:DNA polymerase-3 subunit alpha/error-prone DNA polymerase